MSELCEKGRKVYICLVAGVFPLFFTDYYYNIQKSKSCFFIAVTIAAAVFWCVTAFMGQRGNRKAETADICFLSLGAAVLVSSVLSPYGMASFTGSGGRWAGALLYVCMCLCYLLVSRNCCDLSFFSLIFYTIGAVTAAVGILHFVGVDFWGFLEHVPEGLTGAYLSTIGYSNIFSGFCALLAVSAMAGFCLGGEREVLAVCFIGFLGLFAGNSDGGFLGVFAGFLFLPAAFYKSNIYLYRITQTGAAFSAACFAAWLLGKKAVCSYTALPGYLASWQTAAAGLVLSACLYAAVRWGLKEDWWKQAAAGVHRYYMLCLGGVAAIGGLAFGLVNAGVLRGPGFLRVTDFWGSNRGYIWKRTWELFLEAPPVRKLFGYGPDTLKLLMMQTSSGEMVEKTGQIYDSAHNDLLHLLLTTGIFGAAAWAGCFAGVCRAVWKNRREEIYPWLIPFLCMFLQGFIGILQPVTTPFYFLLAGLCVGLSRKDV